MDNQASDHKRWEGLGPVVGATVIYLLAAGPSLGYMFSVGLERIGLSPFLFIVVLLVTVLPLSFSVGVFAAYRNMYQSGRDGGLAEADSLGDALKGAIAWRRYALPLSLFNLLVVLFLSFLLAEDITWTEGGGVLVGAFSIPLAFGPTHLSIPSSLFYVGYTGFLIYFLEATRRRFNTYNLIPSFYVALAFKWIYVTIAVLVFHFALELGNAFFSFSAAISGAISKAESRLLVAFVVGIFPNEWINLIIGKVRGWFGQTGSEPLPLSLITGIDYTLEAFLNESNVDSVQALATGDASKISARTQIPQPTIESWKRQARLLNILNDTNVIERFRRISVNDIADLGMLVNKFKLSDETISEESFANIMVEKDAQKAREKPQYWSLLIRVLKREYEDYEQAG